MLEDDLAAKQVQGLCCVTIIQLDSTDEAV